MILGRCLALALASYAIEACQTSSGDGLAAGARDPLAIAGHQALAPSADSNCIGDRVEAPYVEETDLWSICNQRPFSACESADGLCSLVEASPIDIDLHCMRPSEPAECVPDGALIGSALLPTVCATDAHGKAWAISGELPPAWEPPAQSPAARWQRECDLIPSCDD